MKSIFRSVAIILFGLITITNYGSSELKVTFTSNEGFLVTTSTKKVLFDALYCRTYYSVVKPSAQLLKQLENAEPPFDNIDLICISHEHEDHVDVNTVGFHLENDLKAKVICSETIGNMMKSYANYNQIKDRIIAKSITPDSTYKEVVNGIPVTVCGFHESKPWTTDHQAFLIDLDGTIIFHGGDSDGDYPDELESIRLWEDSIDIAFLINDYFWAGSNNSPSNGLQKVKEYIAPKNIVIMHNDSTYLNNGQHIIDSLKNIFPNIFLFKKELETKDLINDTLVNFLESRFAYLGQIRSDNTPVEFAPGIISRNDRLESDIIFSPDGKECYFSAVTIDSNKVTYKIFCSKYENNVWSSQQEAPFSAGRNAASPFISADGNQLYFSSCITDGIDNHIWKTERTLGGWSDPECLSSPINSNSIEVTYSETANGDKYIDSKRSGGLGGFDIWQILASSGQALNLGSTVNSANYESGPCIAPDGSYLIFGSDRDGFAGGDHLYISFNKGGDKWTTPIDMNRGGAQVNSNIAHQGSASLSPDGKYLFFMRHWNETNMDVYWVSTHIMDTLRKIAFPPTDVNDKNGSDSAPSRFELEQNYPNPFNPSTRIGYQLPKKDFVTLHIYDLLGQQVKTLVNEWQSAGAHTVVFDASNLSSGVYFYRLQTPHNIFQKKMLLIR